MNLKQRANHTGYDLEENYFHKLNRELIEQIKRQREAEGETSNAQQGLAEVIPLKKRDKTKKEAA